MTTPRVWHRTALWICLGFFAALAIAHVVRRVRPAAWESAQQAYRQRQIADGRAPIDIGLRSLRPRDGRDEERCVSCHLGMVLPDAYEPPFQRHPEMDCALSPAAQGCVACHGGAPRALSLAAAHGGVQTGARGLLATTATEAGVREIEAGCASCHVGRSNGVLRYDEQVVPDVARGLTLFVRQGCPSCHRVDGVGAWAEAGPALSSVGARRSRVWLAERVREPQRRAPSSAMPPLTLADAELERVTLFLLAQVGASSEPGTSRAEASLTWQSGGSASAQFPADLPSTTTPASGALWMRAVGCAGCHRVDELGDGVPDLRRVGWYSDAEVLRKVIEDPQSVVPGTAMPAIAVPRHALDAMVENLAQQRTPLPASRDAVLGEVCGRCHGPERDPKVVVLGRRPPELPTVKAQLSADEFAQVVTEGRPGTAMPPWGRVLSRGFVVGLYESLGTRRGPQ